jgi:pantothenate kinase
LAMEGDSTQIDMLVGDIYGMTYCGGIRVTCFSQPKFKGYLNSRKVNMQHKDKLSPLAYSDPFPTFSEVITSLSTPKFEEILKFSENMASTSVLF